MEPQEESPADTMMNKSSAATAIHTPAGCRPTKAIAFFVSSAVFFAALRVFSAAFCAVFAPPFLADFAYCRLICCFCMKRERGNYIGGVILPGVKVALNSLVSNTAQLPRISFDVPKRAIGKNTIECMRNGIMLGNAAMLDGLIDRMTAELGEPATLIATGGMARFITPLCTHKITYDPDLLLRGLMILYRQNTETKDA